MTVLKLIKTLWILIVLIVCHHVSEPGLCSDNPLYVHSEDVIIFNIFHFYPAEILKDLNYS